MSISTGLGGGRRRREVDADLNLTPYIDLLTCMVAFLLIAAVWTQLARLSVAQKGQGESDPSDVKDLPRAAATSRKMSMKRAISEEAIYDGIRITLEGRLGVARIPNSGRTADLTVVGAAGLEPTTPGFGGRYSIQMSYAPA
jgi:biopolymer transport protein TolR